MEGGGEEDKRRVAELEQELGLGELAAPGTGARRRRRGAKGGGGAAIARAAAAPARAVGGGVREQYELASDA